MTGTQINYCVPVSDHYVSRYRSRIARSKRIQLFATEAFYLGKEPTSIENTRIREFLEDRGNLHGYSCTLKVHKGFVHVFDNISNVAVTVYKLPRINRPMIGRN